MVESDPHILQIILPVLIFVFIVGMVYYSYKAIKTKTSNHVRIASVFIILFFLGMGLFAFLHALIMKHYHPDFSLFANIIIDAISIVAVAYFSAVAIKGRLIAWKVNKRRT
jgi:hypothetical protein